MRLVTLLSSFLILFIRKQYLQASSTAAFGPLPQNSKKSQVGAIFSSPSSSSSISSSSSNVIIEHPKVSSLALPRDPTRLRYRCRVAYDGTNFGGFQIQPQKSQDKDCICSSGNQRERTVQGELERVLKRRFGREIRVVGAGRTDSGVHARGQAVHFDLTWDEHASITTNIAKQQPQQTSCSLEKSMNRMLPTDVCVWNLGPAPAPTSEHVNNRTSTFAWNVMRKCHSKLYSYRICLGDAMDPMDRYSRWQLDSNWVREKMTKSSNNSRSSDLENELAEILQHYVGTHDFVCFTSALEANQRRRGGVAKMNTVRTIYRCELICEDVERRFYRIDFYLNGALYKMVRSLVGTAIDVYRKAVDKDTFLRLLSNDPSQNGLMRGDNPSKPAPPQGLTLERVFYSNDDDF